MWWFMHLCVVLFCSIPELLSVHSTLFRDLIVRDLAFKVAKWTADAYAFVPNPVSIFGQPYSCQLEPPNISVIDVMNRARHEDLQLVGSAPPKGWYEKVFRKALEIPEKPVIYIGLAKVRT